ncbi:hypothetical protein B0J11DRAFT_615617 [Dendryphion nanum]|uniref:Uncharacterized protein n=1 Tax=Dendryphion nanum TaxID=256645 RepID=A0A9P9IKW5_9PLEO|nr:hypothetical protein B0J11DRAFT_615617 [Dendryphion nanum]
MTKDSSASQPQSSTPGSQGKDYIVTNRGTNNEGNRWCTRDYGTDSANSNPYHYSNTDGSYYYSNPDGSKYYNDGQGNAKYTPPGK